MGSLLGKTRKSVVATVGTACIQLGVEQSIVLWQRELITIVCDGTEGLIVSRITLSKELWNHL
jgi:hypothetical protein